MGAKTYKVTLPPNIPAEKFWSLTVYDNQTRSMLDTPQRYPRAGSQSYPSPAAEANPDGSTTVYFGPRTRGRQRGQPDPNQPDRGWFVILRLDSPLEPFFTKEWRPSEIERVGQTTLAGTGKPSSLWFEWDVTMHGPVLGLTINF